MIPASWCCGWRRSARKAQLLGADDYASWSMADQMAGDPAEAFAFMRRIARRRRAEQELADIQQLLIMKAVISRGGLGLALLRRAGAQGEICHR
jgi:hypothetical protein